MKGITQLTLAFCVSAITVFADGGNLDCEVTPWGPWQACDPLTNTQKRYRQIQVAPTGIGLACPLLVDESDCSPEALELEGEDANPQSSRLSVPEAKDLVGPRADAIANVATQISNTPRKVMVGGAAYPYFVGPTMWTPGSLNDQTEIEEVMRFSQFQTNQSDTMAGIAYMSAPALTSMQAIAAVYSKSSMVFLDVPMSTDNSDAVFGAQRLTYKSFVLRLVQPFEFTNTPFTITNIQATQRCGATIDQLRLQSRLYVEDFSTFAQWNDPSQPQKYVPNSISFYCYHPLQHQLLPIEIRLLHTRLVYTPFDSTNDWTLAKMAVETASNNFHSVYHMIATHGTMIPLRVEMMRTMADIHPIRVLLQRHASFDFALERLAAVQLFNTSTALDMTFGWGATGAIRFMYEMGEHRLSVRNIFKQDVLQRGLDRFGEDHKYVYYAAQYWDVIEDFVDHYIDVYYPTRADIINDFELQRWAKGCSKIPQLRDFPKIITCKSHLRELITHLIFTNTITHHGMNGLSTWMGMAAPYSPAALWKPLPTTKTTDAAPLNLMEYTVPIPLLPLYVGLVGFFARAIPENQNFMNAYTVSPFKDEVALQSAITEFGKGLQAIEETIVAKEQGKTWPFMMLRPSRLPFSSWI